MARTTDERSADAHDGGGDGCCVSRVAGIPVLLIPTREMKSSARQ